MSRVSSIPTYTASNVRASTSTSKTSTAKAKTTTVKTSAAKAKTTTVKASAVKAKTTTVKPSAVKAKTTTVKPSAAKAKTTTAKPSAAKAKATTANPSVAKAKATTANPSVAKAMTTTVNNTATKKTSNRTTTTTKKAVSNSVNTVKSVAINSASRTSVKSSSVAKAMTSAYRTPATNTALRTTASAAVKGSFTVSAAKKTSNRTATTTQKAISNSINAVKSAAANSSVWYSDPNNPFFKISEGPNGTTYGGLFDHRSNDPSISLQHGFQLCDLDASLFRMGGNYEWFNVDFRVVTGTARAGLEYSLGGAEVTTTRPNDPNKDPRGKTYGPRVEYAGYDVEASLITASIDLKFPIPGSDQKLILGAAGKAFSGGKTTQLQFDDKPMLKNGASALFGVSFTAGIGE